MERICVAKKETLSLLNREETGTLEDQESNALIKRDFNDDRTHDFSNILSLL
jgi:hypothetical protein